MKQQLVTALKWLKNGFTKNLGMKIGSFIFAFLVWAFVVTQDNPLRTKTLFNVPVTYVGADEMKERSLAPVEPFSDVLNTVNINVQVTVKNLPNATNALLTAQVDLTGITEPGEYTMPIKADTTASFITIRDVIPSNVTVKIEESTEKQVPVEVQLEGTKEEGLYYGTPRISQSTIRIEGPRTAIEQVAKAICSVNISGLTQSTTATHTLVLVDQNGDEIPSTRFSGVPAVIVEVPIFPTRTMEIDENRIKDQITGVAPGYEIVSVHADPQEIEIAGPTEVINAVTTIGIESITLDEATSDVTMDDVGLLLPEDVYTSIPDHIQVRIAIQPVQADKNYPGVDIAVKNLEEGLDAVVSPAALDVTASGSQSVLNNIKAGQILPFVDLAGFGVGTYEVPIKFENEGDLEVTLTPSSEAVTVTIRRG